MIRKRCLLFLFCAEMFSGTYAQKVATLEIELLKPTYGLNVPVKTDLDAITFLPDSVLRLVEVQGNKRTPVSYQIENGDVRILHWIIETNGDKVKKHVYELVKSTDKNHSGIIKSKDEGGTLTIQSDEKNLLRYNYKTVYPPAGIDTAYKRSAFIHPLWTPHGQELTRIQPKDHYHHYGIWNPWTHVLFEKDTVDFWNLKDRKGTVRFAHFTSVINGAAFGEIEALHEHVVFKKNGTEKIALNELQTIKVFQPGNKSDYFIVDITSKLNSASSSPVLLLAYRYAGFGWRTTELWDNKNSEVITSEGKNRKEADGSKAKWCIVQGSLNDDYGGAVMMSYPTNYNHPEPLRIWPENQYDRGDMFANFAPTKDKDWLLEPEKTYVLKYRLLVFNGKFNKEKAESAWYYFANVPKVKIVK